MIILSFAFTGPGQLAALAVIKNVCGDEITNTETQKFEMFCGLR